MLLHENKNMFQIKVINNAAFTVVHMYLFQTIFIHFYFPFLSIFSKIGRNRSDDTTDYCILLCSSSSSTCSCNFDLRVKTSKDQWILQSCKSTQVESLIM